MSTSAAIFDRHGTIVFGPGVPPEQREPIRRLGGRVVEGIRLVRDHETVDDRPEGTEPPRPVLCVSKTDPTHYEVFRDERRAPGDFEPTGKLFTILHAAGDWKVFVENLTTMDRIASYTDSTDTDEIWAEVERHLAGRGG